MRPGGTTPRLEELFARRDPITEELARFKERVDAGEKIRLRHMRRWARLLVEDQELDAAIRAEADAAGIPI